MSNTCTSPPPSLTDDDNSLDAIATSYFKAVEDNRGTNREEWLARYPNQAGELAEFFADLDSVDRVATPLRAVVQPSRPAELASGVLGDFRIIREVGRGGMGLVYEAEQISLGRRVALKVLPFAATMDSRQLQRFHNEAKAAASLHHEHIVPVYGIGSERGVHYYAMQFVDGHTLADMITARTGAARSVPKAMTANYGPGAEVRTATVAVLSTRPDFAFGRAANRHAAELIADAAEALEFAHSMGIVHRDIKPGNLMVDTAGKVWVTDFGLARFGPDAGLTMTGDLLGTLRYMAPEQALAKHGLVDHRADVYGLGATLYELLTGKPAVGGEDKQEILRRIAFEEPIPPRKLDRAIPAELETITLKCLAKNPAERYAAAGELAADLRRYLEDKPIQARPPGIRERAAKWVRRHRVIVAAAFVVLLLAVVGLSATTFIVTKKERQLQAANQAESGERKRAVASLVTALDAIDRMLTRVGREKLAHVPQMEKVRLDVLEDALQLCQRLQKEQNQPVPPIRRHIAALYDSVGGAFGSLGRDGEAEDARRESVRVYQQLVEEFPEADYRNGLAGALNNLAISYWNANQHSKAEEAFREAIDQEEIIVREWPDRPDSRVFLANMHHNMAALVTDNDGAARAGPAIRRAMALREELVRQFPNNADYRKDLSTSQCVLGDVMAHLGKRPEAELAYQQAVAAQEKLVAEFPVNSEYCAALAWSLRSLGTLLKEAGRLPDAEIAYRKSLPILQKLASDFPNTPNHRSELGGINDALGEIVTDMGRKDEAVELHREALTIFDQLATEFPRDPYYRHSSAGALHNIGRALVGLKRFDEAEEVVRQALDAEARLAKEHPEGREYRYYLSHMYELLGKIQGFTKRYEDAADSLGRAVVLTEELEREQPQFAEYKASLAERQSQLAWLLVTDLPKQDVARAVRLAQGAVARVPDNVVYRYALGYAYLVAGSWKEALAELKSAPMPDRADYQYSLGVAYFRNGNWKAAIAAHQEAIKRNEGGEHSYDWFYLAMAYWKLGDREQAKKYYSQAVESTEKNKPQDDELRRLRAEAEELLGLKMAPPAAQAPKE